MTTIIIGAGASGLACAIRLKQNNPLNDVILLERLGDCGRKLLATGNGRCNLSNTNAKHHKEVTDFFKSIGVITRADDEGRIYPYSNMAGTVADALIKECIAKGVEIVTDCEVTGIDSSLCVTTTSGMYMADKVVIATGGMAQSALGSNGSGYKLLKDLNHTITPLSPALVQLTSPSKYPRLLKGHRVKCNMTILINNESVASEYGEVLFTDYGLSGIVTMNLSQPVGVNFAKDNPSYCNAVLDLVPEMSEEDLLNHIDKFGSLDGILGKKIADIMAKQTQGDVQKTAHLAKEWKFIINGTKGFDYAQITCGGAALNEFDNYRSKLVDGLYACGEVLDKQYECGGFNLDHAFYSGIAVADEISKL